MAPVYQNEGLAVTKMIDLRYHVYSLAAVFFALALGIVIGTSFLSMAPGSKSERKTIARYSESMRTLKDQIESISKEIDRSRRLVSDLDDLVAKLAPSMVAGKLTFKSVAIIQTGDYDQVVPDVQKALEEAGARVSSITEISRSYDFADQDKLAQALVKSGISSMQRNQSSADRLMQFIADAACEGRPEQTLNALEAQGVASFKGNYNRPCTLVVIVGGAEESDGDDRLMVDPLLIGHLRRPNVVVVGCESSNCDISFVKDWHESGIASVDNTDWATGRVSLIYALLGEKGRFGIKETSDHVLPKRLDLEK